MVSNFEHHVLRLTQAIFSFLSLCYVVFVFVLHLIWQHKGGSSGKIIWENASPFFSLIVCYDCDWVTQLSVRSGGDNRKPEYQRETADKLFQITLYRVYLTMTMRLNHYLTTNAVSSTPYYDHEIKSQTLQITLYRVHLTMTMRLNH
jgi:hypothetical protein